MLAALVFQGAPAPAADPLADPPLVVYASLEPELCRPVADRFRAEHPNIALEVVELEGRVALERIRGELASGKPVASVWWGGDDLALYRAQLFGVLARSQPPWARDLRSVDRDPGYSWCGQFLVPFAIVFRKGASDVPARFDELADPRYRGRLLLRAPATSPAYQRFLGTVFAHRFLGRGIDERALDWVAMVNANKAEDLFVDDRRILEKLSATDREGSTGELAVLRADLAARARDLEGLPLDFAVLPEAPAFVEGIAKLAGAPMPEAADEFLAFVGREEFDGIAIRQGRIPLAAEKARRAALAPWMEIALARAVVAEREVLAQNLPSWVPAIERRIQLGAAAVPEGDDPNAWVLNLIDIAGTLAIVGVLFVLLRRGRWQALRGAAREGGESPGPNP